MSEFAGPTSTSTSGASSVDRPVRPSDAADAPTEVTRPVASRERTTVAPREARLQLRSVGVGSVVGYVAMWVVFMLAASLVALVVLYKGLESLGVLASVSEALATFLQVEVPPSGVLDYFALGTVLRWAALLGGVLGLIAILFAAVAALTHNVISWITGGIRVRFRE